MTTLIEQAIAGKRTAMETLYAMSKQKVYYTALLLTGSDSQAADAVNYAYKNTWSTLSVHGVTDEAAFTHLLLRKAADYCKRQVIRQDNKAFRIPQGRNFLISAAGELPHSDGSLECRVIAALPPLQRYLLVLHSAGQYLPEQLADAFKLDGKTVHNALETEQLNVERILSRLEAEGSYDEILEAISDGEALTEVPAAVNEAAAAVIDSIARPLEQQAKKRRRTLCAWIFGSILGAVILLGSLVLIADSIVSGDDTETTAATEATTTAATETTEAVSESVLLSEPVIDLDETLTYYADIEIADYGTVTVALEPDAAPVTVSNFIYLAENGFYDGLTFHRIVEGFVMQGGDPNGDGTGGYYDENGYEVNIIGECANNGSENTLSHTRGAISMARGSDYNSASSQFFIVHEETYIDSLDGEYAVFGYVTEGMDIVDTVCQEAEPTDDNGTIEADAQPVITSITIRTEEAAE